MPDFPITILGAGLAGASTAYALAVRGKASQTRILEQEDAIATHASAQNAAMVRALLDEDRLAPWGLRGTAWWNALPRELAAPGIFRRTGSLLLADEVSAERLSRRVVQARAAGLEAELLEPSAVAARWPLLGRVPFRVAAHVRDDGVADPVALCDAMLRFAVARGAELRRGAHGELAVDAGGVCGVRLSDGELLPSRAVVVAGGAWAPGLLAAGGASTRGVRPWRRHIAVLGDDDTGARLGWPASSPFVWHVDRAAYFRAESGRMLVSICDTTESEACRPEVARDAVLDELHTRLSELFPFLLELGVARIWAGLRTYRPSHEFVLGALPEHTGLFAACGLGGHGVTCAGPVGIALADALERAPCAGRSLSR